MKSAKPRRDGRQDKRGPTRWRGVLCAMAVWGVTIGSVISIAPSVATAAEAGHTIQYGRSTAPFWRVGSPDADLTKLCRRGKFNQLAHEAFFIGFFGPDNPGRGYTGIAKQDYNLSDPTGKSQPGVTYHFFNDGYSNCKVYSAPDPGPAPNGGQ